MIRMTYPMYLRREAEIDGRIVRFSYPQIDVLFVLLVNRGRPVSVGDLIAFLWPDPDAEPEIPEVSVRGVVDELARKGVPIERRGSFGLTIR